LAVRADGKGVRGGAAGGGAGGAESDPSEWVVDWTAARVASDEFELKVYSVDEFAKFGGRSKGDGVRSGPSIRR